MSTDGKRQTKPKMRRFTCSLMDPAAPKDSCSTTLGKGAKGAKDKGGKDTAPKRRLKPVVVKLEHDSGGKAGHGGMTARSSASAGTTAEVAPAPYHISVFRSKTPVTRHSVAVAHCPFCPYEEEYCMVLVGCRRDLTEVNMLNTPDWRPSVGETEFQGNWPEEVDAKRKPRFMNLPFGGSAKKVTAAGERQRLQRHLKRHFDTSFDDRARDLSKKVKASGRLPLQGTKEEKKDRRRAMNALAVKKYRSINKAKR